MVRNDASSGLSYWVKQLSANSTALAVFYASSAGTTIHVCDAYPVCVCICGKNVHG